MNLGKISFTSIAIVAIAVGLFLIYRKPGVSPIVNTSKFSPVYDGINAVAYINGPRKMAETVQASLSKGQRQAVTSDTQYLFDTLAFQEPYRDHDRII